MKKIMWLVIVLLSMASCSQIDNARIGALEREISQVESDLDVHAEKYEELKEKEKLSRAEKREVKDLKNKIKYAEKSLGQKKKELSKLETGFKGNSWKWSFTIGLILAVAIAIGFAIASQGGLFDAELRYMIPLFFTLWAVSSLILKVAFF